MRLITLTFLVLAALAASAAEPTYPFWDGQETIADYAKRTGLEPTKTLNLGNGVKLELVLIPAGKFLMGTSEPESPWIGGTVLGTAGLLALILLAVLLVRAIRKRRWPQFSLRWLILLVAVLGMAQYGGFRWWRAAEARENFNFYESPAHEVSLSTPHYMGKYEVTQEEYERVMGNNPSSFKGARNPVESVLWEDAQEFCRKLSERTGREVRLPTEAEWEYGCRAGRSTPFHTGETISTAEANYNGNYTYGNGTKGENRKKTIAVGSLAPNAFGLYDMHGNVFEWCGGWHGAYVKGAQRDPTGEADGMARVLRGGSWNVIPGFCRSAFRSWSSLDYRYNSNGFRVVVVARTP
jgi:formylglycine-generating enzyme required for sulfatase activity